ncbi:channel protein TolC [Betaproteobacteria bacterium]|nr:channel protein TolC [Betaproteobacteria bacterium]GHU45674.1 channel protein TolC [Betaproteobacteria bacterium]
MLRALQAWGKPMRRQGWFVLLGGTMCIAFCANAQGERVTLAGLLERAQTGEPTYLAARTDVAMAKARRDQAFGALLPQIGMTGSANANDRNYRTRSPGVPTENDSYKSHATQLSLTQPIWRYANIVGYQQSRIVVEQTKYQMTGAGQVLFEKLVTAWFDVLAARDAVAFAERQAEALNFQWKAIVRGEELGENSLPQLEEARSKLEQAKSDLTTAQIELQFKRVALEQLVGPLEEFSVPYLRGTVELSDPTREKLETWLSSAETGNPALRAAQSAFEAAADEVRKQRAQHYPTLDLVASYGKNSQEVGGFPGQYGYDIKQGTVGLQLNIPIYSGGAVSAKTAEAVAQQEKARLEMDAARRTATLAVKQAWFIWQGATVRAAAGQQAIRAARSYLDQATKGANEGLFTQNEILQAEQQLRAGERDFRKARYDQVVAHIKLKAATGILTASDVAALDALMVAASSDTELGRSP